LAISKRSIPSLDGLRALSVLIVVVCHAQSLYAGHSRYFLFPLRNGHLGVATFFVISGYLITYLLLKEDTKTGKISIRDFYIRRSFRILPPFYAFLAVVGLRSIFHIEHVDLRSFLSAAFYTWNYDIHATGEIFGHLWSLCLEEQFYLLWPLTLVCFSRKTSLKIAVFLVAFSPVSRVATYFLAPAYRGHIGMMLHSRIDTIMLGCILALVIDLGILTELLEKIRRSAAIACAALLLLQVENLLGLRFGGYWDLAFGITIQGLCCAVIVIYCMSQTENLLGRFLNHPVMRHIGTISYAIYLWQQMFSLDEPYSQFPFNCVIILACAELSYFLIERPSYSLRDRVLKKLHSSQA